MVVWVNDLFCGAGGMGLGFKKAGFRMAGAWDFDKYAVESYGNNVSPKVKQADISQMTWNELPYADVWTFGFPCQDISVAGKQAGMVKGETRSGLFYEVMRLLNETETNERTRLPKVILAENVKAVKQYLPEIEKEYDQAGYKLYHTLYNSKYWGVPQNRERYFMVGIRKDLPQTFQFPTEQHHYVPRLSEVLEHEVDEKYYISDEKAQKIIEQALQRLDKLENVHACITPERVDKRQNGRRAKGNEEEMFTLTAQDLHGVIINVGNCNPSGKGMNGNVFHEEGLSPTLTTNKGEGIKIMVSYNRKEGITGELDVAHTLNASDWRGLNRNQTQNAVVEGYRIRRITPREAARLQGFSESFKILVSDSQAYKQFGNAVTVNVSNAIAEAIKTFLESLS